MLRDCIKNTRNTLFFMSASSWGRSGNGIASLLASLTLLHWRASKGAMGRLTGLDPFILWSTKAILNLEKVFKMFKFYSYGSLLKPLNRELIKQGSEQEAPWSTIFWVLVRNLSSFEALFRLPGLSSLVLHNFWTNCPIFKQFFFVWKLEIVRI